MNFGHLLDYDTIDLLLLRCLCLILFNCVSFYDSTRRPLFEIDCVRYYSGISAHPFITGIVDNWDTWNICEVLTVCLGNFSDPHHLHKVVK